MKQAWRLLIPLGIIPLLVATGMLLGDGRGWMGVAGGICLCTLILFYLGVDNRRIGARRMVVTAALTALSTVGRLIPLFKPITAVTMMGGIHLGKEAGFVIGSLSALISNFAFGQGPWTPFQMLAWGLIGYLSGLLAVPLKKSRPLLLTFGMLSGIAYSMIMDLFTVLWGSGTLTPALYLSALLTAIPHTVLYAVSNLIFLFLLASPMGEKLERLHVKYGI